jgi:pimeloyl-ACP methyl ester carboxylesterase
VAITRFDVARLVAQALHGPATIRLLPRVVDEMRRGDFSSIIPRMAELRSGSLDAMPAAMDSASGASDARIAQIRRERDDTLLGDALNFPDDAVRTGLGVADLGPAFRSPVDSDVPVLLISGTLDGRTPPRNAEEVRAGLRRATHLILDGAGHGDGLLLASPAITETVLAFLSGEPLADRTISIAVPRFELPRARGRQ